MRAARTECDIFMNFHQILPQNKKKSAPGGFFDLYLLMHAFVLVVVAVIRAGGVAPLQKTVHFVLVQAHRAHVRVLKLVIIVKFAALAIR